MTPFAGDTMQLPTTLGPRDVQSHVVDNALHSSRLPSTPACFAVLNSGKSRGKYANGWFVTVKGSPAYPIFSYQSDSNVEIKGKKTSSWLLSDHTSTVTLEDKLTFEPGKSWDSLLQKNKDENKNSGAASHQIEGPGAYQIGQGTALQHSDASLSCEGIPSNLVPALETAESLEQLDDILLPMTNLSPSDYSKILYALKDPHKITNFFSWLRKNRHSPDSLDYHTVVFDVLGKRQEWTLMNSLLQKELSSLKGRAACELFNVVFSVCSNMGSPDWASKWFRLMIEVGIPPDEGTCALVMTQFQQFGKLEEMEFVYQHMEKASVKCSQAYSILMSCYTRLGQFKKVEELFNRMKPRGIVPGKEHWFSYLNANAKQGKAREAEEVIARMQESGIVEDIFIYNCMITANGKAGNFKGARDWFHKLEKDGLQPNAVTYRSMIGSCGRAGKLKEALGYYDRMRLDGFYPTLQNFHSLIHLHRKVDGDGRLLDLLADMKQMNCCPNSSTLDVVVKVYERYRRLEKIPVALNLLRDAGWSPDVKSYNILIRAYIRSNLVQEALEAFEYLCSRKQLAELLCHNLICVCKSQGRYKDAIHVFQQMQQIGGIEPSLRTSCTVLEVYSLLGAVAEGEGLFETLRKRKLDSVAYNVAINMYLRGGLPEKAAEVMKLVNEHEGLQPDSYLFLSMLRVCGKCGLHQESVNVYWRMLRANMTWTESLFNGVIHHCGRALPLEEITKVFQAMVYAKVPVNTVTCNVMIDIYGKAGLLEKAESVLRMAQKQQVVDQISFNTIIDAYGKYKEFDKMEAALIEMQNEGFKGSLEAYNSMIDAYGKSGQVGKMENILERMNRAGCKPNLGTFNTLINVYGKEGLILDMQGVLEQMEEDGLKPDSYTYNTMIYAYGNADMPNEALRLFKEMKDAGFSPDRITYTCLISALEKCGNHQEAAKWSLQMQAIGMCS